MNDDGLSFGGVEWPRASVPFKTTLEEQRPGRDTRRWFMKGSSLSVFSMTGLLDYCE